MKDWTSDNLGEILGKYLVTLKTSKELPAKVNDSNLIRDDHLNILLHTYSSAEDRPEPPARKLGEVYHLANQVEIEGVIGNGIIEGLSLINVTSSFSSLNQDTATHTTYSAHKVSYNFIEEPASYIIDNIANVPNSYIWPYGMSEIETGETIVKFGYNDEIEVKTPHPKKKQPL